MVRFVRKRANVTQKDDWQNLAGDSQMLANNRRASFWLVWELMTAG